MDVYFLNIDLGLQYICGEKQIDGLLIKIFNTNREALAEQEIVLLKSVKDGWPFMTLLYDKKVNGYLTLVCRWPAGSTWLQESCYRAQIKK